MYVERGAAHSRAVQQLLHGNFLEGFLLHERDERIAQRVSRSQNAAVCFRMRLSGLFPGSAGRHNPSFLDISAFFVPYRGTPENNTSTGR